VTTFSQRDARTVASILRDAAQAEILPRFRGEIAQDIRQKSSSTTVVIFPAYSHLRHHGPEIMDGSDDGWLG